MILPYPPGVPLLMPGEMITEESRAVLDFLLMLCSSAVITRGLRPIFTGRSAMRTACIGYES